MRAIDTSVLARFVIKDHPEQLETTTAIIANGAFVPLTMLLETARVRQSFSGRDRAAIAGAAAAVRGAPARSSAGADLAGVLHLVASRGASGFATFDRGIARAAGPNSQIPVETLA